MNLGRHLTAQDKVELLDSYGRRHGLRTLVETGLYLGAGSGMRCSAFQRYIAVDCQPENVRLAKEAGFDARLGDSAALLPGILRELDEPALFWLDAHGIREDPEEWPDFPTLRELELLADDPWPHVVLVDDLWMFVPDPPLLRGAPSLRQLWAYVDGFGRWRREDADEVMRLTPA